MKSPPLAAEYRCVIEPHPASDHPSAVLPPADVLHTFLAQLLDRCHRPPHEARIGESPEGSHAAAGSLMLAIAAMRASETGQGARHIVVLGPTQTGKSTLVNLLVGENVAGVSPLAGHTIHPHAFILGGGAASDDWLSGWARVAAGELDRTKLDAFAVGSVGDQFSLAEGRPLVVWDTPDFDSLAAHSYERGVYETAALADVVVFVLSKEKYADLAAWDILRRLIVLRRPLVVCLNKMSPEATDPIRASLRARLDALGPDAMNASIHVLPYVVEGATPGSVLLDGPVGELRSALRNRIRSRLDPAGRRRGIAGLIRAEWSSWTASLRVEHAAIETWEAHVRGALDAFVESYRSDYLDHPLRYDSFRRATAEMLQLLELPAISQPLTRIRQVVTWPARRLIGAGRSLWSRVRHAPPDAAHVSGEVSVLHAIVDDLLTALGLDAARRVESETTSAAVWRAIAARFREREPGLRAAFHAAVDEHSRCIDQEIRDAAQRLYQFLREKPAILNSLRAARVTVDVAAIAFALKSGGLHLHDAVLAPAMLGFSSMLTEGALGTYMGRIAADLKRRQFEQLRMNLVDAVLSPALSGLPRGMEGPGVAGMSPASLTAAERALDAWERGHE